MTAEYNLTNLVNWQQQAAQYLIKGDYAQAASLYEQAIEAEPEIKSYYWHLGLMLMLQGQEAEAQMTWLLAIAEGEPEQVDQWTGELLEVLQTEAERREELDDYAVAWAIRQHIREINPRDINNLLQIIQLSLSLKTFILEDLTQLGVINLLQSEETKTVDPELLLQVLQNVLSQAPPHQTLVELTAACLPWVKDTDRFVETVARASIEIGHLAKCPTLAAELIELCLRLDDQNLDVLTQLTAFYQNSQQYDKGIETARRCYSMAQELSHKVYASHLLMRGLTGAGGHRQEAVDVFQKHKSLLSALVQERPTHLPQGWNLSLHSSTFFLPYFKDEAKENRLIQNQLAELCQVNTRNYAKEQAERYSKRVLTKSNGHAYTKPLKIGYFSHCLRMHSVGWLARWVFRHHNREQFQVHAYMLNNRQTNDPIQDWYIGQSDKAYQFPPNGLQIAEQIYEDEIDILIDLNSTTLDISCEIMALKPAPVQVTWLGWDASGIPAIDYFIADPYVLPDTAEDYYAEKIWRLPETYIAVDGFEVGIPTLRREHLDIPSDAVVYLSGQRGYKRHPDTARLQMKIIKEVPNSYFLIKGFADEESIKGFFNQIAEEEGVSCDRLRFLPNDPSEVTHRANLGIADVVLDTYPYNGATTTLETLWMCIPLVTRVGEQFAARNSYTMMVNAGITEGIAWTDEEYIEWGVRLGKDEALRQQVSWKLIKSKQTAPLWNGKKFTREMEKAYEQMWAKYVESSNS
ncbi:O-linked N-acetylglucosamine transferase family protein [Lyngbya aestuarii]|uniref:O-linked N-acetylglucosamine transferase family protein n=1 Tax=Lyngbya aestuarii TaxID=118322 RepID=UPI00403D70BB